MRHIINGNGGANGIKAKDINRSFYWTDEKGKSSLVIKYDGVSGALLEVNMYGVNLRYGVVERWMESGRNIYFALLHLADAVFDPEFFRTYEAQIINKFNNQNGTDLKPQRTWSRLLNILSL